MNGEAQIYAVKGVTSGDTLVLLVPNKLPPVEKTVTLSNIDTPKLARKTGSPANDEPYAWEAREFNRKMLIGKMVKFQHEYSVDRIEREFGKVTLQNGDNVAELLVAEGLAEVRHNQQNKGEKNEKLEAAQEQAKREKKGKWSADPGSHHVRNLIWDPPEDIVSLAGNLTGQTHKVLVEQVLNGGLLRVLLLPSHQMVSLGLSGIQCPSMRGAGGSPEPFAVEARFFTERAVLHREVNVLFEGYDNRNSSNPYLFGSIVQGEKCFQAEILDRGLGQLANWSISKTSFAADLKTAEHTAKVKQVNKWRGFQMPATPAAPEQKPSCTGRVTQINSGDTVTITRDDSGKSQKCTLASCRANKRDEDEVIEGGSRGQPVKSRAIPYKNYSWEAREYLREKTIGKRVTIEPEYERTIEQSGEVRSHCNIFVGTENVALGMLQNGYAKAIAGQPQERSRYFEDYKEAEQKASGERKGIHSKDAAPELRILDLVKPTTKKCQQYLAFLQGGGSANNPPRHKAIIEHVLNPCRYKVYVHKQQCAITLALTGLTAPSSGRDGNEAEPYAQEAMDFAKDFFYHRDAEVEVESNDNFGSFFGSLFVDNENVAVRLLKEGLVATNNNAERNRYHMNLKAAQMEATREKKGVWSVEGGGPRSRISKGKAKRAARGGANEILAPESSNPWETCIVTEIVDSTHVYVQMLNDKNKQIIMDTQALLAELEPKLAKKDSTKLAVHDLVVARFTADDALYRARVTKVDGNKISVYYIDFGNSEQVGRDRVWVVPEVTNSIERMPAQAVLLNLAFLAPIPDDSEYGNDAALCLRNFLQDYCEPESPLLSRVEYTDGTKRSKFVMLKAANGQGSAPEHLLKNGLGRIESRWTTGEFAGDDHWKDTLQPLVRVQEKAQNEKINFWQYGVVTSDDEDY